MLPQELGSESEQLGGAEQMKRHGGLWAKICSYDNIVAAHHAARRGKLHYREVQMVDSDERCFLERVQQSLISKTFTTSPYEVFDKFDGRKQRTLHKLPYYPDRIVQHAVLQIVGPLWVARFIRDTFQSIPGRGTHDARKRVEKHIRGKPPQYALKFDIQKYYPNVNTALLKMQLRRTLKCADTLWLLDNIIDSADGLPIGNYTSQYFGNLYLNAFDWWVVQNLCPTGYFRYCDDIVLLADTAEQCHEMRRACFERLTAIHALTVKPDWQVFPVESRGLDFVGYVFRSGSTRLRAGIARNFRKKCKAVRDNDPTLTPHKTVNGIGSYWGWVKHANAKRLWFAEVDTTVLKSIDRAKEALRHARLLKLGTSRLPSDRPGQSGPLGLQHDRF
jgi:RNA-directed DNA polymerase